MFKSRALNYPKEYLAHSKRGTGGAGAAVDIALGIHRGIILISVVLVLCL